MTSAREYEFYLARFYRGELGWRLTFCEIINFAPNIPGWCLLAISRDVKHGFMLEWGTE